MEVKERKENYMKKNSFTQVLVIAIAAVCIICAVVMINVSNESENASRVAVTMIGHTKVNIAINTSRVVKK